MMYVFLALIGLAFGSFVNALVWRLREKDKKRPKFPKKELSILKGRSLCPSCGYHLAWYDLIPVVSWLSLNGKCRYCKKPISVQYPLVELSVGFLSVISYMFWPYTLESTLSYTVFGLWILLMPLLMALVVYDLKWLELPTEIVYAVFGLSVLSTVALALEDKDSSIVLSAVLGSVVLGGLFWLLYQISQGKWIGGGDVRLGFAIGAYLGWVKALLALSLGAYIGTVVVVVAAILGKYHRKMKLPFGPLLIAGWYVAVLWGQAILDWYLQLIGA